MDRAAGVPADRRSVSEPAAGGETAVALEPARGQAVDHRASSVVCSIVKDPSPHSVPIRLDPEGSRFPFSPHSVPLEFLPVPGGAGSGPRNSDSCRGQGNGWEADRTPGPISRHSAGTPSGTCVAADDEAGQAVPRFDRQTSPLGSPVPNRVHHPYKGARRPPKRDALKGENRGSLRRVQVRRLSRRRGLRGRRNLRASTPRTLPGWEWGLDRRARKRRQGHWASHRGP